MSTCRNPAARFGIDGACQCALPAACCSASRRRPTAPPAPQPRAAAAPAARRSRFPFRRRTVELPPPQPLTPEAHGHHAASGRAARLRPPPAPAAPAPARTSDAAAASGAASRPPAPAAAPPPAEPERPPIQEIVPADELKRLQERSRGAQARDPAAHGGGRAPAPQPAGRRNPVERVFSFLKQSDEAEQRGDMRQADELAERALVLARELKP